MLIITPQIYSPQNVSQRYNQKPCARLISPLQKDTISFSSRQSLAISAEDFVSKFDNLKIADADFCQKCAHGKNILGKGAKASVYKIPFEGFEGYLLKISDNLSKYSPPPSYFKFAETKLHPLHEVYKCQNDFWGRNFGEPVAEIRGVLKDPIWIIKKVAGKEVCVDDGRLRLEDSAEIKKLKNQRREQLANMPQSAYDDYAADIAFANQKGFCFDPSSTNILLDGDKFHIIDLEDEVSLNMYKTINYNPPSTILRPFYTFQICSSVDKTDVVHSQIRSIVTKTLKAAKKAGLMETEKCGVQDLQYSLEKSGYNKEQNAKIIELFQTPYSSQNTEVFCKYIDEHHPLPEISEK